MFTLLIPFYNEEQNLPLLIQSITIQKDQDFTVLFVDNNSKDNSAKIVRDLEQIKDGSWFYIKEEKQGLWSAIKAGITFIKDQNLPKIVARMDSDSLCTSSKWTSVINSNIHQEFGYIYGPFRYEGFEEFPIFKRSYSAYNKTLTEFMSNVGWFGTGTNAVFDIDNVDKFLKANKKNKLSEEDLKLCLFILFNGGNPIFNPHIISSSGRNIIKDQETFKKWCFYNSNFYSGKWSNKIVTRVRKTKDLTYPQLRKFFYRRSLKLATRNILPLIIYDQHNIMIDKINCFLDLKIKNQNLEKYRNQDLLDTLFNEEKYESFTKQIEKDPLTKLISLRLAINMFHHFNKSNFRREDRYEGAQYNSYGKI